METSPIQPHRASHSGSLDMPLDRIAGNSSVPREERLAAAGRAFEAVFLRQILESAQKTVLPSGLTQETASGAVYRDLVTDTLADRIARSGQFGLASTLLADWSRCQPVAQDPAVTPVAVPAVAATPEAALAAANAHGPGLKPFRQGHEPRTGAARTQIKPSTR